MLGEISCVTTLFMKGLEAEHNVLGESFAHSMWMDGMAAIPYCTSLEKLVFVIFEPSFLEI